MDFHGHPDDQARTTRAPLTAWTDEELAAITAAFRAGDLPTEVVCGDRRVFLCVDEAVGYGHSNGKADAMQQMLRDLVLAGRQNDPVQISDPKDPAATVQHSTVGALAAAVLRSPRG
jgi:hypothetical protein